MPVENSTGSLFPCTTNVTH